MRKALLIGINKYDSNDSICNLNGCANDAQQMGSVL